MHWSFLGVIQVCSSTDVDWLCITSQWSFAAKDVIQIWDEPMACIFLNLCFSHTQKSTVEFWLTLLRPTGMMKIRPFVLWFWIWDFSFLQLSAKCQRFPFLTALARLKRQHRLQPSPSRGWYCSSPTCCWIGRKRLGPLTQSDYVIGVSHFRLPYLLSPSFTLAFFLLHPILCGPYVCHILCWF